MYFQNGKPNKTITLVYAWLGGGMGVPVTISDKQWVIMVWDVKAYLLISYL